MVYGGCIPHIYHMSVTAQCHSTMVTEAARRRLFKRHGGQQHMCVAYTRAASSRSQQVAAGQQQVSIMPAAGQQQVSSTGA